METLIKKYILSFVGDNVIGIEMDENGRVYYPAPISAEILSKRKIFDTYEEAVEGLRERILDRIEKSKRSYDKSLESLDKFEKVYGVKETMSCK